MKLVKFTTKVKSKKCPCTKIIDGKKQICVCGVTMYVKNVDATRPQFDYSVPNYEKVKEEMNHKEYKKGNQIITYDEIKKFADECTTISSSQIAPEGKWIRPSTLTQKPIVKTIADDGEEIESQVYYEVTISRTHYEEEEDGTANSTTHFWVDEFYYAMVKCGGISENCLGLIQEKVYTDPSRQEDRVEHNNCSSCFGTLFNHERIDKEIEVPFYPLNNSWYKEQHPIKILSWGGGTDSTAMILKYGDEADEIIMADTGAEEFETYEYIKYFIQQLPRRIRNKITIIKNDREGDIDEWHYDQKLQPMPFANRQCTDKWKLRVIHRYIRRTYGTKAVFDMVVGINKDEQLWRERILPSESMMIKGIEKLAKRQGISVDDYQERIRNALQTGGQVGEDGKIVGGCQYARNVYPLIEEGIGKKDEIAIYEEHGITVPPKSGCYFCPMKGKKEWNELKEMKDGRFENTIRIQDNSTAKLKIMDMSEVKKNDMRCSCSNGTYDADTLDEEELVVPMGRGM